MSGSGSAAGRRVLLPLGREANLSWEHLNNNGLVMLQRAFAWAMGAGAAGAGNLLLVVGNVGSPSSKDQDRKTLMESWGYAVTLIDDGDSQANFNIAMAANDVVYVTDGVSGPTLVDKVTNTTTPVVNEKGSKLGNFGFSSVESGTVNAASFTSTDAAHYITEPFSGSPVTVFTSSRTMGVPSGTLAPDLQNVGEVSGTLALATLEDGATLWNGGSAPARRVHLPFGAAATNQLTADGETLMRRAIEWAGGVALAGPIAHWKLDETSGNTAVDSVGGHDGTLVNSQTWGPAMIDGGLSFNGSNDYIDVPHDNNLLLTQGMTFMAWGNTSDNGGGYQAVISKDTPANGASNYWFGIENDELVFGFWASGAFRAVKTSAANLAANTWYHLVASFDNATDAVRLYVDGTEATVGSITFEPTTEAANLMIGGSIDAEYWGGSLDDVRIYDRVLGATEIADIAAGGGGPAPQTVLLVVANAASPSSRSADRRDLIASWGHAVTLIDDGDSQTNFNTAMAANDVVYVTDTVSGPTLLDKVTNTTTPVVNEKGSKLGNFGFSSIESGTYTAAAFTGTDALHYITEPFGGNPVTVFTSSLSMAVPSGTLAPDLQNAGEIDSFGTGVLPVLATLDAGATLWSGGSAPARRAHLPFGAAETAQLTADGETLMQRAIDWAAGEGAGTGGGGGGPTGVVFEEFSEAKANAATNVSVDKPAGTAAGDLLIATLVTDGSKSGSMSPPAGWTVIDLAQQSSAVTYGVWWKLAGASEPASYTWSWGGGGEKVYGTIMRFTGHDPATPIDVTATAGGSSSVPSSPAVTTTVADAMILRLGGFDDDDITVDAPGLTGHTAITMDKSSQGNGTSSSGAGYVMQPAAGDSGTSAFALTNTEEYRTVTIAIAPAP